MTRRHHDRRAFTELAQRLLDRQRDVAVDDIEQLAKRLVARDAREDERKEQTLADKVQITFGHEAKLRRDRSRTARRRGELPAARVCDAHRPAMRRPRGQVATTTRALRRAARAACCLADDPIAASLLASALAATPTPARTMGRPVADDLLSVRLAAEHGMRLQEFLALDAMELIDLFWPEKTARPTNAASSHPPPDTNQ